LSGLIWFLQPALAPYAVGRAIDRGILAGDVTSTILWCVALFVAIGIGTAMGILWHTLVVRTWLVTLYGTMELVVAKVAELGHVLRGVRAMRFLTLVKVPRRIDWRVMIPKKISTMFSHDPDRSRGREFMRQLIDSISHGVPAALKEGITLGRTLTRRAADILAYFDRPGTSNGSTEAICEYRHGWSGTGWQGDVGRVARV
jgi:hypothetical protein